MEHQIRIKFALIQSEVCSNQIKIQYEVHHYRPYDGCDIRQCWVSNFLQIQVEFDSETMINLKFVQNLPCFDNCWNTSRWSTWSPRRIYWQFGVSSWSTRTSVNISWNAKMLFKLTIPMLTQFSESIVLQPAVKLIMLNYPVTPRTSSSIILQWLRQNKSDSIFKLVAQ